ncbi:hypothetical protein GCM10023093_10780 [Nemorincola caseinilytica]|uniref:Uncharacterized protein n=1 Tax=Nemorincola caseinilytica TaxID=2054315 RepID=A0ABP8NBJ3_9BACT
MRDTFNYYKHVAPPGQASSKHLWAHGSPKKEKVLSGTFAWRILLLALAAYYTYQVPFYALAHGLGDAAYFIIIAVQHHYGGQ